MGNIGLCQVHMLQMGSGFIRCGWEVVLDVECVQGSEGGVCPAVSADFDVWPKMEYSVNPWVMSRSLLLKYVLRGGGELSGMMMSRYDAKWSYCGARLLRAVRIAFAYMFLIGMRYCRYVGVGDAEGCGRVHGMGIGCVCWHAARPC